VSFFRSFKDAVGKGEKLLPELECDLVRSLRAAAAAVDAESPVNTPVLVLCSGEFFIMFTLLAAAECNRAADISALSTSADDDDNIDRKWGFPNDGVMQLYDVSGDSMTSQRAMRPEVGEEWRSV